MGVEDHKLVGLIKRLQEDRKEARGRHDQSRIERIMAQKGLQQGRQRRTRAIEDRASKKDEDAGNGQPDVREAKYLSQLFGETLTPARIYRPPPEFTFCLCVQPTAILRHDRHTAFADHQSAEPGGHPARGLGAEHVCNDCPPALRRRIHQT